MDTHVDTIIEKLAEFLRVYPEYADRQMVGILATLYPDDSMVHRATRKGVLVMRVGDETMQALNPDATDAHPRR